MLFHIYVELKNPLNESEIALGFSEAEFQKRVVRPYARGRSIVLNGRAIETANIQRIRITRGETPVSHLMARAVAEERASSLVMIDHDMRPYTAFSLCEEVTDEYITEPPGSMSRTSKRRRNRPVEKPKSTDHPKLDSSEIRVDVPSRTVRWGAKKLVFSPRSFLLLSLFAKLDSNRGRAITFSSLMQQGSVWDGRQVEETTIRGAVTRLRQFLREGKMGAVADAITVETRGRDRCILFNWSGASVAVRALNSN